MSEINFDYNKMTPFKWFILENFPFLEDGIDALTNYQLFCKLGEEINKNRDAINDIGENEENVVTAFNTLYDYVHDFFDNLDLQEQVNIKLDEMAEDGTLTTLIGAYIQPRIDAQNQLINTRINAQNDLIEEITDNQNERITSMGETVNLHTSQIANLVANASSTEENSELIDVRTAFDGQTYTSAGESVRTQVKYSLDTTKLNRDAYDFHVIEKTIDIPYTLFEFGTISTSTGAEVTTSNGVRSKYYLTFDELIQILKISYVANITIFVHIFQMDNTWLNCLQLAGTSNNEMSNFQMINPAHKYKIVLSKGSTISSLQEFVEQFTFKVVAFYNRTNDIYDIEQLNLINPNTTSYKAIINQTTGYPQYNSQSNYNGAVIPVESNTQYYSNCASYNASFFDGNMELLEFHGNATSNPLSSPFTTPVNAKYMGLTIPRSGLGSSSYLSKRSQYYDYGDIMITQKTSVKNSATINNSPLYQKTIDVFGDSISSTDYTMPYWGDIIASNTDCNINNYGISATSLAHTNDRHLNNYHFTELDPVEIGYDPDDPSTWSTGNCFCERYTKVSDSADAIVIMGGTNDDGVPLGTWDSTDTATFYGALNVLFSGIIDRMAGKKILVCTPMQKANDYTQNVFDPLTAIANVTTSVSLQKRAEAIKQKCDQYGLPCLDLYNESGINGADTSKVYYRTGDTLHPSSIGQVRIASLIQSKLEDLFRT